ncbi:MAG: YHYH protein, partial [Limisphaerales bacterium]
SNQVSLRISGSYRYVSGNSIPVHPTGQFPNRNNPNSVRPQNNQYRLTMNPRMAQQATPLGLGPFGIALNGVVLEPGAAEFWQRNFNSGWQYEAKGGRINLGLDQHNAHVQPTGSYHYHGMPIGLVNRLAKSNPNQMVLIGYAADGFPIYARWGYRNPLDAKSGVVVMKPSYKLRSGNRPSGPGGRFDGTFVQDYEFAKGTGHLDDCNGRFGVTPEYPGGIYHYFVTDQWPYLSRQFRGTPDSSFLRRGPGGGGPGGRRGPPHGRRGPPGGLRPPPR